MIERGGNWWLIMPTDIFQALALHQPFHLRHHDQLIIRLLPMFFSNFAMLQDERMETH